MSSGLIGTTLLHFLSILPLRKHYNQTAGYINVILASTIFSVLYHLYEESNQYITILDYIFAGAWFLYDCKMAILYTNNTLTIVFSNCFCFFIHSFIPYNESYFLYHSIWHCINAYKAYKAYYISRIIQLQITNTSTQDT